MVPAKRPASMCGRKRALSSGSAKCWITSAAPCVRPGYMLKAVLAPLCSSCRMTSMACGPPNPPASGGMANDTRPRSKSLFQASLKPAGVCTVPPSSRQPVAVTRRVQRSGHLGHEARALVDDRVALHAREVRVALVLEQLLHVQVLVEGELDRAAIDLVRVGGGFGHGLILLQTSRRHQRPVCAAACQECRGASFRDMLPAMRDALEFRC